jgi:hypothetical protein
MACRPREELIAYGKLLCLPDWDDSSTKVVDQMKALVRRLVDFLIERQAAARDHNGWDKQGHSMTLQCSSDWKDKEAPKLPNTWTMLKLYGYLFVFVLSVRKCPT